MAKTQNRIPTATFSDEKLLTTFWKQVNKKLSNPKSVRWFNYSPIKNSRSWNSKAAIKELLELNQSITSCFCGKGIAGVYAIWVDMGQGPIILYIGQSTDHTSALRLRNHFLYKHDKTGSKLANVKQVVAAKGKLGFTYVQITPKEMRQFVEQKLIQHNFGIEQTNQGWNIMGKGRKQKPSPSKL